MLAVIVIAAFCGAVLEHKRLQENYEFRMDHLHNCYMDEIKRNAELAARPARIRPDRQMVTHIHPDPLPPDLCEGRKR